MGTHKNRLSKVTEAVLMNTHNLCFRANIKKCILFYYIKVGCKGAVHRHVSMMTVVGFRLARVTLEQAKFCLFWSVGFTLEFPCFPQCTGCNIGCFQWTIFRSFEIIIFCFVFAICDLVHDVETIFHLSYLLTASGNLF